MAETSLSVLIVEDSRLARLELSSLLKQCPQVRLLGEAADVPSALEAIAALKPDVLLLDIQLPGQDGFALLDQLEQPPMVIFTTAFDAMAVRGYDYDAVDYLLKPLELLRLQQALEKAAQRQVSHAQQVVARPQLSADDKVLLQDGERCVFVPLHHIRQFVSEGNYYHAQLTDRRMMLHGSLALLEQRLPSSLFFRANRQQIINTGCIDQIELLPNGSYLVTLDSGDVVELSRRHGARFRQLFAL